MLYPTKEKNGKGQNNDFFYYTYNSPKWKKGILEMA